MSGQNYYLRHTEKYLDLLELFMTYLTVHKTELEIPQKANIVIFDASDRKFSKYSLRVLKNLISKGERNIVEVTRTGIRPIPWRISKTIN